MNDMFLSHAAFASLPRHHIAAAMHAPPSGVVPATKPSHAEDRKGQAGNGHAQSKFLEPGLGRSRFVLQPLRVSFQENMSYRTNVANDIN